MERLSTKEFEMVMRKGRWIRGTFFSLRILKTNNRELRFGVAVSKQLARKATQRNYYKRVLRHLLRVAFYQKKQDHLQQGYRIILFAQPQIYHKKFEVLKNDVQQLLQKALLF